MNSNRCEKNVYQHGEAIGIFSRLPKDTIEKICIEATKRHGSPIDWYYGAGRCVVKALGDGDKASKIFHEVLSGEPPPGIVKIKHEQKLEK